MTRTLWLGLSVGLLFGASSCAVDEPTSDTVCEAGKCDGLPFLDQLKGREDPIGKWLRSLAEAGVIDAQGVYHGDKASKVAPADEPLFYTKLIGGLNTVQGCNPSSVINYALADDLISGDPLKTFPRLVSTVCADNDQVTNAFVATLGSQTSGGDIALDDLEMFAWDATQQKYFFYASNDEGNGNLKLEVEPARCSECHLTPRDVDPVGMARIPIMNELTKAWTHWNAGTGGVSESFHVPDALNGKPLWERYGVQSVAAASRFEKVIRDANALRVTPARAKGLFRPAKLDEAMSLIRPLFCDEQVNYVSELATGEISIDAVVAGGIKAAFRSIQSTWTFPWFNNDSIRLPIASGDEQVFMVPVRGVADLTFESQLQGVLSPAHMLAVRALDWKQPALSSFRCDLWRNARVEFATKPPALTGRNRDAVKVLYEAIMKLGGMSTRNLASGKFVVMDIASESTVNKVRAAIAAGTVPTTCRAGAANFCETDANGFGVLLQGYVDLAEGQTRAALLAERDRRVCNVVNDVQPAGAHKDFGPGIRIPNHPSFFRIPADGGPVQVTVPQGCNTRPPRQVAPAPMP